MKNKKIGDIIREKREELKITQDELCAGLCHRKTISRLENNTSEPSKYVMENLLFRLGLPKDLYYDLQMIKNIDVINLRNDIVVANRDNNFDKVLKLIDEIRKYEESEEPHLKQFILRSEAISRYKDSPEEKIKKLQEAISLTVNDFDIDDFDKKFINLEESKVILNIANTYCEMDEREKAIDILERLLSKTTSIITKYEEFVPLAALVFYSITQELSFNNEYYRALELIEKAINLLLKYNKTTCLAGLLANKAFCLCKIGKIKEGRKAYVHAINLFDLRNQTDYKEYCINEAKTEFNIEIPII